MDAQAKLEVVTDDEKPKAQPSAQAARTGGRPLAAVSNAVPVSDLARRHVRAAVTTLRKALKHPDGRVQVSAAKELLDRASGRAAQAVISKDAQGDIQVKLVQ